MIIYVCCQISLDTGYILMTEKSDTTMLMSLRQAGKLLGEQKKFTSTFISWSNQKGRSSLTSLFTITKATRQGFT